AGLLDHQVLGGRGGPEGVQELFPGMFGGLASLAAVLLLFPVLMRAEWSAALGVALLGMAAFVTGSPLQLMVMEKAAAAPSLASSANQAAFNLANAGGAWIGGLALAAGFGATSPAVAGAALAVLGLGVASVAYAVDRRREVAHLGRVVASHVPEQTRTFTH
ncbi:MFS transporter, partial [Streptomyces sp. NPDC004561]